MHTTFFLKKSVIETCLFRSLTFQATQRQFQVQNVVFVTTSNVTCEK